MKVTIHLAALVRLEYAETIEVPDDASDADLDALVEMKYDSVDGGEYRDDAEYWEQATCYWEKEG